MTVRAAGPNTLMECTCIRHTELPHTSRLFSDLVYHPERVNPFYRHSVSNPNSFSAAAAEMQYPPDLRAALVEALREDNQGSGALTRLAAPETVAVVTGQQVGLFSGPAYTIYKALTAAGLARQLSQGGIPAVPVFWLATEDHDFAEVNHFWGFDRENRPAKLEMNRPAFGQPVGGIELLNPPIEGLESLLEGFPFAGEVASLVRRCYTPGRTMGAAFRDLLKELLAGFDLIYVDPMSPRLRELAAPAMRAALENAPELTNAVLERNAELRAAGYHAQVHVEEHTSFVFLLEGGQRLALRRQGNEYVRNGRRFNTEELSARAEQLSPNALLRPVIQDSILPTVAYVGGPAELAYLAQAEVIYRAVLGRMPVAVPRKSFTILDQRSRKLMRRYNLTLEDFFIGEDALRELVAARLIPPELSQAIATTRDAVSVAIGRLSADLQGFDVTLKKALQKSRAKIEHQLSKIEGKVGREAMIRDARASRDAACLYGLIYPDKHLQERLYSILPFLARHGPDLVEHLYENLHLDCPDHQLVVA